MGEHDPPSVVWDCIAVYPTREIRQERPPKPLYEGGPVVKVTDAARAALGEALR